MKPHEEEWDALGVTVARHTGPNTGRVIASFEDADPDDLNDEARALLAAQAPAMARLLLRATVKPHGDEWSCLGCHTWEEGAHNEDCALLAILRAAGVIA